MDIANEGGPGEAGLERETTRLFIRALDRVTGNVRSFLPNQSDFVHTAI